jgi:hypothetical protein
MAELRSAMQVRTSLDQDNSAPARTIPRLFSSAARRLFFLRPW